MAVMKMFWLSKRQGVVDPEQQQHAFLIECQQCGVRRTVPALSFKVTGECAYCGHEGWGFPEDLQRARLREKQLAELEEAARRDPVTRFGTREALLADLGEAVQPGSPIRVLALFDLAGADAHRQIHGLLASDELFARLARVFAELVEPVGRCYRSRQDEFWALLDAVPDEARRVLDRVLAALREAGSDACITPSFGLAFLPREADAPTEALIVADRDLGTARRARDRRQLPR